MFVCHKHGDLEPEIGDSRKKDRWCFDRMCQMAIRLYCRGIHIYIYIGKYPPGGNISWCNLGEKIWKGEEKKGEMYKKKEERGKKMRKGDVKG